MSNDGLGDVRGVVLDLDGTVFVGDTVISGAPAVVDRLRSAGLGIRFATNTTRLSLRALGARPKAGRRGMESRCR